MVEVKVWRVTKEGKTLWAKARFSSEAKALEWATQRVVELLKRGFLAGIQIAV